MAAAERLDTTFHSADELSAHTIVPILVRIPRLSSIPAADRARSRRRAVLLALGLGMAVAATVLVSRRLAHDNETVVALLAPRGRS